MLAHGPAQEPEHRRRFEQEAKAASALSHPNVAHVYDVGLEGDVYYLAMELVEGRTLRQLLREGEAGVPQALAHDRVLEYGIQIARGIARAHELGVVHRDLKPENVMVTPEGWVKILDFGLAKLTGPWLEGDQDSETIDHVPTRVGQLIGTVEYMSPEQAGGRPIDHRTDQFSLGSVLYEMITGRFAFRRDTPVLTLAAILEREPEPLAETAPGPLKPGLETVVRRCLRKEPADRYATTDELVAALEAVSRGEATDETKPALPQPATLTEEAKATLRGESFVPDAAPRAVLRRPGRPGNPMRPVRRLRAGRQRRARVPSRERGRARRDGPHPGRPAQDERPEHGQNAP